MVEEREDLFLHVGSVEFVADGESFSVDDFHRVETLRETDDRVSDLAEVDVAEIAAAEPAEEAEVVQAEAVLESGAAEAVDGLPGGLVGFVGFGGGVEGNGAPAA